MIIIIIIIIIIMYANLYSAITLPKNYKGALHENCHRGPVSEQLTDEYMYIHQKEEGQWEW